MGLRSKSARKEKRKKEKRARKAAQQALYEKRREAGVNSKSKRARKAQEKKRTLSDRSHPQGPCGNIGCDTCRGRRGCSRAACGCGGHEKEKAA